jgi:hypothetical protein
MRMTAFLGRQAVEPAAQFRAPRLPTPIRIQRPRYPEQPANTRELEAALVQQRLHCFPSHLRVYHLRPSRSFSANWSNSASASSLFSLVFSASISLSRRGYETVVPPRFASQL